MTTQLHPYVTFDGDCEQALKFWAEILGGKLELMRMGTSPVPVPPEYKDRIMHGTLTVGSLLLMASDSMPGDSVTRSNSVSLSLTLGDESEQTRVWEQLSAGGQVLVPLAEQFWGRFGMLVDKFGIQWMLSVDSKKK